MTGEAQPKIIVVGLGPAGTEYMLPAARRALVTCAAAYVRTARHPAVTELRAHGLDLLSFDKIYEREPTFDAVYRAIVEALCVAAVEHKRIAYAVPGSPVLAERTVTLLLERCALEQIEVEIVPGLSFADMAWAQVGIDAMDRGRVLDAHRITDELADASGPALIAQVDDAFVASDVKLALLERLDADVPVTVLQRLGLTDALVATVPLAELDRACTPDHLTAVFVDLGRRTSSLNELLEVAATLRAPGGCPWDAEQTHQSLAKYLIEEAYEAVDAIAALPLDATADGEVIGACADLVSELGDVLYQVVFHATIGQEHGAFTFDDVAAAIRDKLVRRHPHVFGDVIATTSEEVVANWNALKRAERGDASVFADIPSALPALQFADALLRKAEGYGVSPSALVPTFTTIANRLTRDSAMAPAEVAGELGAYLVQWARAQGVDAESALRSWNDATRAELTAFAESLGSDIDPADVAARWHRQSK